MREPKNIVVTAHLTVPENLQNIGNRAQERHKTHCRSSPGLPSDIPLICGADELTRSIDGQSSDIAVKAGPSVVLKQILLYIGKVESRHLRVVIFQILRYCADRFRTTEIADQRNDEIFHFHVPQRPVSLFGAQIT